ncbi:MAG: hypothetical protein A2173_06255 [Planctomycetes bacterium RBG_13_44_8b]|nr:MAG: hypothetical protein A2173_06255 [Planctomycetes bacterium RBG_13_44_8b]
MVFLGDSEIIVCFWQDERISSERMHKAMIPNTAFGIDKFFPEWSVHKLMNNTFLKLGYQSKNCLLLTYR